MEARSTEFLVDAHGYPASRVFAGYGPRLIDRDEADQSWHTMPRPAFRLGPATWLSRDFLEFKALRARPHQPDREHDYKHRATDKHEHPGRAERLQHASMKNDASIFIMVLPRQQGT